MFYMENDHCVGRSLFIYGEWAEAEIATLLRLTKPGAMVIDIGANIGTHSVALAKHGAKVVAFEPQMPLFQVLCANLVGNDVSADTMAVAIGDRNGQAVMERLDYGKPENNLGGGRVRTDGSIDGHVVPMRTLDSFGLPGCDLIKADIEGGEADMVIGAKETILRYRPLMYLEDHDEGERKLVELVKSFKYDVYDHCSRPFNKSNWKKHEENIFGEYIERNILCVPSERPFKTNLGRV